MLYGGVYPFASLIYNGVALLRFLEKAGRLYFFSLVEGKRLKSKCKYRTDVLLFPARADLKVRHSPSFVTTLRSHGFQAPTFWPI